MKKREFKVAIISLIILAIIIIVLLITNFNDKPIKLEKTAFGNDSILELSDSEKEELKTELIDYLNNQSYYTCDKIDFYINQASDADNTKYFYALVIGGDRSLVEITKLENGKFKFNYVSNQISPDEISAETGVSYRQIVNYKDYQKQKELEEMRKDIKNTAPDGDEIS